MDKQSRRSMIAKLGASAAAMIAASKAAEAQEPGKFRVNAKRGQSLVVRLERADKWKVASIKNVDKLEGLKLGPGPGHFEVGVRVGSGYAEVIGLDSLLAGTGASRCIA